MSDPVTLEQVSRSIKRLTFAVWILLFLAAFNWAGPTISFIHFALEEERSSNFQDWSLDEKIKGASVIVLAKWRLEDGLERCVISEILKQDRGVPFNYIVGDEYFPARHSLDKAKDFGDGQVMFFIGSPPRFRYSVTYSQDIFASLGGLTLGGTTVDELRQAIKNEAR